MKELKEIAQGCAMVGALASGIICLTHGWYLMLLIVLGVFGLIYLLSFLIITKD